MNEYLTIAEAADLAHEATATMRKRMSDGTLTEGVHFFRPRGKHPIFKRESLVAWIEGRDGRKPTPRKARVNWEAVA